VHGGGVQGTDVGSVHRDRAELVAARRGRLILVLALARAPVAVLGHACRLVRARLAADRAVGSVGALATVVAFLGGMGDIVVAADRGYDTAPRTGVCVGGRGGRQQDGQRGHHQGSRSWVHGSSSFVRGGDVARGLSVERCEHREHYARNNQVSYRSQHRVLRVAPFGVPFRIRLFERYLGSAETVLLIAQFSGSYIG